MVLRRGAGPARPWHGRPGRARAARWLGGAEPRGTGFDPASLGAVPAQGARCDHPRLGCLPREYLFGVWDHGVGCGAPVTEGMPTLLVKLPRLRSGEERFPLAIREDEHRSGVVLAVPHCGPTRPVGHLDAVASAGAVAGFVPGVVWYGVHGSHSSRFLYQPIDNRQ